METKTIISNVVTAVATAAVLGVLGFFAGVFEKGAEAINKDQIRAVLREELKTDSGETYGKVFTDLNGSVIELNTTVSGLSEDVAFLHQAVLDLASE